MQLTLMRHGKTEYNELGRIQTRIDVPLSTAGKHEASAIVLNNNFDVILTSPMTRCIETANAVTKFAEHTILDSLLEVDISQLDGEIKDERFDEVLTCITNGVQHATIAHESQTDIEQRICDAITYLRSKNVDNVLIVSHGLFISAFMSYANNDFCNINKYRISNLKTVKITLW